MRSAAASPVGLRVETAHVLAFRTRASHLDEKLPHDRIADAVRGGLQDSAPRAGVVSLHARVAGVEPSDWSHPSLAQIWFRGADYIVPREDLGVFTLGCMPRDAERSAALEKIADDVLRVLDGRTLRTREITSALPELEFTIRLSSITGRVLIRWDASKIWAIGCERPSIDPEDARLELARRFLRWFSPVTKARFAWWAGIEPADASATWRALEPEIEAVQLNSETRHVMKADLEALMGAEPIEGVRFIPHSDPLIKIDGELVVPDERKRFEVFPKSKVKPDFWPVSGGLLVDGEIAGSWSRQQRNVVVNPWEKVSAKAKEAIEQEALSFPIAGKRDPSVRFEDPA